MDKNFRDRKAAQSGSKKETKTLMTCTCLVPELQAYEDLVESYMEKLEVEKLWRCLSCNKTNYSKQKITHHVEVHHVDWPQGLACSHPRCRSRFRTKQGLQRHLRQIHDLRPGKGRWQKGSGKGRKRRRKRKLSEEDGDM